MRSTRSSALRWPSWRRKTLTICSRLLDRLPPDGLSRARSGSVAVTDYPEGSDAKRGSAPARRDRVRILDREAAAGDGIDEVDLGALEVVDADRVDEQPDAVRLEHL